jgi:hypothetical protein
MLRRRTLSCGKHLTVAYTSNRAPQAAKNLSRLNRLLFTAQTFAIVRTPRFHCDRLLARAVKITIVFCFKVTSEIAWNPYRGFAVVLPDCTDYKAIPWANFQNFGRIFLSFWIPEKLWSPVRTVPGAGELTEIADLYPIVANERPKNIGILG